MLRRLLELLRCRRGIAATEFALILPFMVVIIFGTAEVGNALLIDRKVTRSVHTGADLVAQATAVTTNDLNDILDAMEEVLRPFPVTAGFRITSIYREVGSNNTRVDWSIARNTGSAAQGSDFTLPPNLLGEGESVIVAEMTYQYTPFFEDAILGDIELADVAYLRPRRTQRVVLN